MKKIFLLLLLFTIMSRAQWVQVNNGVGNRTVSALAYSGNNIFAGTLGGVYLSTNNGTTWTLFGSNNQGGLSLAINGNNIFAGTYANGVYLSTNNGTNWTQALNNLTILSLAINGNNVFAGCGGPLGVYLSTNNGTSWTQTSLNNRYIWALVVNGNNVFAGCGGSYGVYVTTNNGTSWTQTSLNNRWVYSLALNGNNVFAGTENNGVYLSTDNGVSWTQTSLNNVGVYSLVANSNNVFAGGYLNGVYVSTNNGTIWTQRSEGLPSATIFALTILNNYIFAGTQDSGVYRRPLSELIGIQPISNEVPEQFSLYQNYPNPFNPTTKIRFQIPLSRGVSEVDGLPAAGRGVLLVIYDILGKEIATLYNEALKPGTYEADWDAANIVSGVYFYRIAIHSDKIISGDFSETKKMVLIK